jgi:uncharacterized coiled-coil protein SlyX
MKITLYKEGCEPYVVESQEALDFHLNQGWSKDKIKDLPPATPSAAHPSAYPGGVDVTIFKNRIAELEGQLEKAAKSGDVEKIRELNDIIAAKDQQITEMQSDFEELTQQMSKTIQEQKEQLAANVKPKRGA